MREFTGNRQLQGVMGIGRHLPSLGDPVAGNPDDFAAAGEDRQAVAQGNRRLGVGKKILDFLLAALEKISEEVLSTVNKTEEPVKKEDIRKSERSRGRPSKANSHLKSELKEKIIPQSPEPLAVEKSSEELERERELSLEKLLGHKGEKQKTLREGKNFAEKE